MSEYKRKVNCSFCGEKDSVTVTTKQSKHSRTIKVSKCEKCKEQAGYKRNSNKSLIKMTKTLKSNGQTVRILKQYRNQSNNYKSDDSRVYADLYKVVDTNGNVNIYCETELN